MDARVLIMRACRAVTVLGWPGAVALRSAVHPAWGAGLSAGGAAASLACEAALALLRRRGRGRGAQLAERAARREADAAARKIAELAARVDALDGVDERLTALGDALAAVLRHAGMGDGPEPCRLRAVAVSREGRRSG